MRNLLTETLEDLKNNGKNPSDVLWCGTKDVCFSWDDFEKLANTEYDNGYGSQKVANDLLIVGSDWWLERHEYDGSECWVYNTNITKPSKEIEIKALTVDQSINPDTACGWESLKALNNIEV